jgi:hypothetical protein
VFEAQVMIAMYTLMLDQKKKKIEKTTLRMNLSKNLVEISVTIFVTIPKQTKPSSQSTKVDRKNSRVKIELGNNLIKNSIDSLLA